MQDIPPARQTPDLDVSRLSPDQVPPLVSGTDPARCDPLTHAATCPACMVALSGERDQALTLRLAAWREGWHAAELAHAGDYSRGYADGRLARKHIEHTAVEALALYLARWQVRGEARTRATFGRPHPDDYQGRETA